MDLVRFAKLRHGGAPRMSDARDLRAIENAEFDARADKSAAKSAAKTAAATPKIPSDPRVGILMKKGRPMYYAFLGKRYIENRDLEKVELELKGK